MLAPVVMELKPLIDTPIKSNMAANRSDLNKLRNLDSPSADIIIYEI